MAIIMKKIKKQFGFTLLELLMVAAIFSITVLVSVDLFFTIAKLQKRVTAIQRVESDARFTMESMVREARMGMIDYDYYNINSIKLLTTDTPPKIKPVNVLATRDQDGNLTVYRLVGSVIYVCAINADDLATKTCDLTSTTNWQPVTPDEIEILKLDFYITPDQNPFLLDDTNKYPSNNQPKVTIVFQSRSLSEELAGITNINLQTTVSSRIYKR